MNSTNGRLTVLFVGLALALGGPVLLAQSNPELAAEQHPFRVYSAFWPNLHHVLWAEAWAGRPASTTELPMAGKLPEPLTADLTPQENAAWKKAVKYYDDELAEDHPLFDMGEIRKRLIAAGSELPATGLDPEHRQALTEAAPVYRKYWWAAHDRANRAWLADQLKKVAALSPAVPNEIARLYGTPWFTSSVRVDVVRVASREGAYTAIDPAPAHITIASSSPGNVGWMGTEVLFHEASHALARPILGAFQTELSAQGKASRDLWHVALFYMTGEIVRKALAGRGIAYETYLYKTGLFNRAWPQFKAPIETYWKAYVDGEMPRDEAVKKIVATIK